MAHLSSKPLQCSSGFAWQPPATTPPSVPLQARLLYVAACALGAFFAALQFVALLWRMWKEGVWRVLAPPGERPYPEQLLHDPRFGAHRFITANGVRFHYVTRGPDEDGAGAAAGTSAATLRPPLMLCLHGFPESWYSWRYVLYAFSTRYRVVAPDLRGYGETARAQPSWWAAADYRMEVLVEDVRALVAALGYERVTLVAHDWGALIAWTFAHAHPAMVERLVVMNVPHPLAYEDTLSLAQVRRSFYIFVMQLPLVPEAWLYSSDLAFLTEAFLGVTREGGGGEGGGGAIVGGMGVRRREHPLCLRPAEVEGVYKWAMGRAGGVTAAVNYYRCIVSHNAAYNRRVGCRRGPAGTRVAAPVLLVWGAEDGALGVDSAPACAAYCGGGFHLALVPRASHWVQQDAPEEVTRSMAAFLGMAYAGADVPEHAGLLLPEAAAAAAGGAGGGRASCVRDLRDLYATRPAEAEAAAAPAGADAGGGTTPLSSRRRREAV